MEKDFYKTDYAQREAWMEVANSQMCFYQNGHEWLPFYANREDALKWSRLCTELKVTRQEDPYPHIEDYINFRKQ